MSNVQSYNALIDRFHAFASGHFILKRFSHGQIEVSDLEKFGEYPFMHVVPSNVTYAKGMKTFSFQIVLADLPRDKEDKPDPKNQVKVDENRTMTILLGDNDKLVRYVGLLATPVKGGAPKDFSYGKGGIREELLARKKLVLEYTGNKDKGMIVIIKPSKKSNYRNLVDILDEMAIVDVPTYAIVNDYTPEEKKLLEGK